MGPSDFCPMFLRKFPNLTWLKQQISERFEHNPLQEQTPHPSGWPSVILNTQTTDIERPNITGPLSLFTNLSGTSRVSAGGTTVHVDPHCFFLSNPQQSYTLEIDAQPKGETFNIHFGEHFASLAWQSLTQPTRKALDSPDADSPPLTFPNHLYRINDAIRNIIYRIKAEEHQLVSDPLWLEEQLYELMGHLFAQQCKWKQRVEELPALKASTRQELAQRLSYAMDFMYSHVQQSPTLEELAQVSMLSKYHFIRLFKAFYHKTPHQMLSELRIQKAQMLLQDETLSMLDIAQEVGLSEGSALSRLFFKQVGYYPSQYRQLVKN